ncbi:hypothetical protein Pmani_015435 [Petrolisthes manimaculis]|uniref:Uncharacterized protein n=1 Tax=Petrolisthes manimaculis TaxID=1843537 RepID=A0AAE1UC21_9EUCA|nr:hypothetical protein Pmani_015435 [Petrolisthes manimaculis]
MQNKDDDNGIHSCCALVRAMSTRCHDVINQIIFVVNINSLMHIESAAAQTDNHYTLLHISKKPNYSKWRMKCKQSVQNAVDVENFV